MIMKEFTKKDMIDFVEYYDNLPENEQIAYDFVLPDFLENRKNNDGKAAVINTTETREQRGVRIAKEIKTNVRKIALILDTANSSEPYMALLYAQDIKEDLVQGDILKIVSIKEFKKWVKTSKHRYNNEIRKIIATNL